MHQIKRDFDLSKHLIRTPDGWNLLLTNLNPVNKNTKKDPILLLHGLAANSTIWNYRPGRGLASYLVKKGYSVWLLDFRGHGESLPKANRNSNWLFEDFVNADLPTAIRFVYEAENHSKLKIIAHSMGSLILLLSLGINEGISSLVKKCIALSPGHLMDKDNPFWVKNFFRFLMAPVSFGFGTLCGYVPSKFLFGYLENESISFISQISKWAFQSTWKSKYDGKDYWKVFEKVTCPVDVVCMKGDNLWGRQEAARHIFDLLPKANRNEFYVIEDHLKIKKKIGHYGAILGHIAHEQVFPFFEGVLSE